MIATDSMRHRVLLILLILVVTVAGSGSVAALRADSGSTYASPSGPGATATYTATVVAQRGDVVTRSGLKRIRLDFSADPDFSGRLDNVSARDVTVRVEDGRTEDTRRVGPVWTVANSTEGMVRIALKSAYTKIQPGDEIVVEVADVTNTEIAIENPSGLRGFALDVAVGNSQGQFDGPVEVRYTIDPNAQATRTTTGSATTPNATTTGSTATESLTPNVTTGATMSNETARATESSERTTTEAMETAGSNTETSTSKTMGRQLSPNTTGTEPTETSGPGFGLVVGVVALLVIGLFVARRE
jgi:PGF-CTERM protein